MNDDLTIVKQFRPFAKFAISCLRLDKCNIYRARVVICRFLTSPYFLFVGILLLPLLPCIISEMEFIFFGGCEFDRLIHKVFGMDAYYYMNVFPLQVRNSILRIIL